MVRLHVCASAQDVHRALGEDVAHDQVQGLQETVPFSSTATQSVQVAVAVPV